jgi:hypothetical protein
MKSTLLDKLTHALLYEGYLLYPYRPAANKNRYRFNFGLLAPQKLSHTQAATTPASMQTECLIIGNADTRINIKVRFLQLQARDVGKVTATGANLRAGELPDYQQVELLKVGARSYYTCQQAIEREITATDLLLSALAGEHQQINFAFSGCENILAIEDESGLAGIIIEKLLAINGCAEIAATQISSGLYKITSRVINLTLQKQTDERGCNDEQLQSLISVHTILSVQAGEFISLLEPPTQLRDEAAACQNIGCWPVLVGAPGEKDLMLSSPIILYDYPQIAPESAGDLFDATEIDEILTLRVLTLTDEEKSVLRHADERVRKMLERTENLSEDQLIKLHGIMRPGPAREEK